MAQISWGSKYNVTSTSFSIQVTVSSGGLGSNTPTRLYVYAESYPLEQCGGQVKFSNATPQLKNVGYGIHTFNFSGLAAGTTYWIMAKTYAAGDSICYPLTGGGCCSFGDVQYTWHQNFIGFNETTPTVTTSTVTSVTFKGGYFCGNVTNDGGAAVTTRGMDISTSYPPSNHFYGGSGTGTYCKTVTDLLPNTTYYYKAWAVNSQGFGNGAIKSFTTSSVVCPTVVTNTVTSITSTSGYFSGNVTSGGDLGVDWRGMDVSTTNPPTWAFSAGSGTGSYGDTVSGLLPYQLYYYRSYAGNDYCDEHGAIKSFTTLGDKPYVTTSGAGAVMDTTATAYGYVNRINAASLDARGTCWVSGYGTPTIANSKTNDGTAVGSFTSSLTGLTKGTVYSYRAYATNSFGTTYGDVMYFTTDKEPTVTTDAVTYVSASAVAGGGKVTASGGDTVTVRGMCWNTTGSPTTADNTTSDGSGTGTFTSSMTSLDYNQTYYYRAYATNYVGTAYGNEVEYLIHEAPSNLQATSIGDKEACVSWVNNSYNDEIEVYYKKESQPWVLYDTVTTGTTTACFTGLSMDTQYTFNVCNIAGAESKCSNQLVVNTTVTFLPPFCESDVAYVVSGSTCGNSDGKITLGDEDYSVFYNFVCTDASGGVMPFTDYWWSGLTAGWYSITATPKLEWWYHYGNDSCTEGWIPIEDSDTSLTLVATQLKIAICQGFGSGDGRINYIVTDSNAAVTGLSFTLWNERQQVVSNQTYTGTSFTGNTNITTALSPDNYYGVITDNAGCHLLVGMTHLGAEDSYGIEGVQRLFLTEWDANTSYNYYSSSDEDWYISGVDTLQYSSTKIASYSGLTDFWYEITLNTATMTYEEALERGENGLTYSESVTVKIPHADNSKWKELVNILTKRYIIVFQDNNDNWWTCFYRNGAEVKAYRRVDNQYEIVFTYPSTTKMLTAIDYNYVKLNLL